MAAREGAEGAKQDAEAFATAAMVRALKELADDMEGDDAARVLDVMRKLEARDAKKCTFPNHLALRNARNRLDKQRKRHEALDGKIEEAEAALAALRKEQGELLVQVKVAEAEVAELEAKAARDTAQAAASGHAGLVPALFCGVHLLPALGVPWHTDGHAGADPA